MPSSVGSVQVSRRPRANREPGAGRNPKAAVPRVASPAGRKPPTTRKPKAQHSRRPPYSWAAEGPRATLGGVDPREYLDARWYALVRSAVDLGVPEEDAPALVQRVLDENRRAIRRAGDPDPLVHEALRDAALGPPPRRRRRWLGVAVLAAALTAIGLGVLLTRPVQPPTDRLRGDQVPSWFGYDGGDARALLESRGLRVTLEPFPSCEVYGRVVATDPPPGITYHRGDAIRVYTSLPSDITCLTDYQDRATAWTLLDFANGRGPAPAFADRVFVYADDAAPMVLDHDAAVDPDGWAGTGVLDALRKASQRVSLVSRYPVRYAIPAIRITRADEGLGSCGVPDPAVAGTGDAFAVLVRPPDRTGCGVRLDVFRQDDAIVAVALYSGAR
jgi:PASTA domain-containing protein